MAGSLSSVPLSVKDRAGQSLWAYHLRALAIAWAILLMYFWRDASDIIAIWWDSSTFNHCLLIVPILGWLIYLRKDLVQQIAPVFWWPACLYVGIGALGWMLGDAAGVAIARQAGLMIMLQGTVAVILGPNATRGLLFPLFYMFFLVPFGEEFVPLLQTVTAKMSMILLGLSGIPAHIDGIFINTPGGYFKVAEACSGVMFLVAMVAYGALAAHLCFHSWWRRALFMAACVIVPILANGLRAFGTIYIAQHGNIAFASGFDHIFYGWIFFGIVIAIVMGLSWRFFDKGADDPAFDPAALQSPARFATSSIIAALALLLAIGGPVGWASYVAAKDSPIPARILLPQIAGWQQVNEDAGTAWQPHFDGANHYLLGHYRKNSGHTVDLAIILYDRQSDGRELIGFGQGAADPLHKWVWVADMPAPAFGKAERIKAPGPVSRDVISFYRVGGVTSGSGASIKLAALKARLMGNNQQAVAILVSSEYQGEASPRAVIDDFLHDMGNVDILADQIAGLR